MFKKKGGILLCKFKIEITETLSRICDVKANSIEDAISIIKKRYYDEKIVLCSDDYVDTTFEEYED